MTEGQPRGQHRVGLHWNCERMSGRGHAVTATATAPPPSRHHCRPVTVARPKLRGTDEVFASRLFGAGVVRSNALETLVIAGFVRGLFRAGRCLSALS